MKIWRMGQLGFYWRIFVKFRSWVFFENLSRKFVPRKSDKWNSLASTGGFSWNFVVEYFSKICRENSSHENLTNGTARLLLADFCECYCWVFFENLSRKFIPWKTDKWNRSASTGGFSWNFIVQYFSKICQKNSSHENLTNGTARLILADFCECYCWVFFENLSRKFVPRKSEKWNSSASTGGFSLNFIVEYFSKIFRENSSHENLTKGTARLLLADFREIS